MGLVVEDGQGNAFRLGVDRFNRAKTFATNETQEHFASKAGRCFMANTTDTADLLTLPDGFSGPMIYLKNNSLLNISLNKILFGASAAGLVMTTLQTPDVGSVANSNVHTPVNLNSGSTAAAEALVYTWDETGSAGITGLTGGAKQMSLPFVAGPNILPVDGSFIVGPSQSLMLNLANNTGSAIEACVNVRFLFVSV